MLIEQIIELQLRGPGSPGQTCTLITGYFPDKTKIKVEEGLNNLNFSIGLKFVKNLVLSNGSEHLRNVIQRQ